MTEPITRIDDAYEFFYDSGRITMRLKKEITSETKLSDKPERLTILIPVNYPNNKKPRRVAGLEKVGGGGLTAAPIQHVG